MPNENRGGSWYKPQGAVAASRTDESPTVLSDGYEAACAACFVGRSHTEEYHALAGGTR